MHYVAIIAITGIVLLSGTNLVFAESDYDFVAGIHSEVTFHFRDGSETVHFPVFTTTSDLVENIGTSFEVQGVVEDAPYLYEALDESYKHRMSTLTAGSSFEYDYRFFDIDVNIVQGETVLKSFAYANCEIIEYGISTLTDDYESYIASNTGFAVVDNIEFRCGGVHMDNERNVYDSAQEKPVLDHGELPFPLAENARTFLTFEFNNGVEKIESVIFVLTSGFAEADDAGPSFQIITAVLPHPLIDNAISESQKVSGLPSRFNEDFDVYVEFVNPEMMLRGLDFEDCIVSGYDILTLMDKEEGYTGKRGFATAEVLDVACSGLEPVNPLYEKLSAEKESRTSQMYNVYMSNSYNMGTGPHVIATFDFDQGIEVVDFPEFYQGNLIAKSNPTFELVGIIGNTPLLYDVVDNTRKVGQHTTGVSSLVELFDVNLVMSYGHDVVRGFDYTDCRIVDYVVKTEHDAEESFYKGFALTNEFHFECLGYQPFNPMYDAMFKSEPTKQYSSIDYQKEQFVYGGVQPLFG